MAGDNIGRRPLLGLGAALGLAMPALAQQAPAGRPVTLVVPFPPGGSTDVMARLLAERMAPALGQPVLVENRPGAATAIGAEAVAGEAPDGYTVLVNSGTTLTINPLVLHHLPYKVEDFAPVSLLSILPFAFLVQNRLPATIPEFVALAKAKPGQLNYGTNGPSSFNNIAAVLVNDALGIRMQDVTYRGDAAQLNDFVAGTLDVLVVGGSSAIQPHRNGQGRIIGWTGDRRMPFMPEIPTFAEYAPGTVAQTYFGLAVPARTPRLAIERLSRAAAQALQDPTLRDRLLAEGQFAIGSSPEEYAAFLRQEADRWRPVLQRMNLQLD
ncbi:MAG: tripartite tricarboxylate transporter substrate binding protein [Acetobacteraceae bacterium]|nr:tripartite tricarboxylate transporter substrate binding protein [Acetobacteraceae bacterium]